MNYKFYLFLFALNPFLSLSQNYWQQSVDYKMQVDIDVENYTYSGKQQLKYKNNSPDILKKVFYHLYFNAFKPGSEMSVKINSGKDKNNRFKVNIDSLTTEQIGYLKVHDLRQDGQILNTILSETILEVDLARPLIPGDSTLFTLDFFGKIPDLIRRAGKNSREGIALSMAQWYPKLAEYDNEGWNAEPYLGREFHGVWGNFDVKLTIDKRFCVASSGYIQNSSEVGHGYSDGKGKSKGKKLTWHFIAPNVHDFTWSADPDYIHDIIKGPNEVDLHFFYKKGTLYSDLWKELQPKTAELMKFYNQTLGNYPYKQYTVAQGGDGGMEYAMLTLITGNRSFGSLVGVTAHELAHSWFQHLLATNEMKYEWMDEGFTTYISTLAVDEIFNKKSSFPLERSYENYIYLANSGKEEPQETNANRYDYNMAYELSAYSKGAVFLSQLGYIIGVDNLAKTLKSYSLEYRFKHPVPNDFRRVAERISGIHLGWYLSDWTQTTKTIDYSVDSLLEESDKSIITLKRIGSMSMPLDILINFKDGSSSIFYIPIDLMRGEKLNPYNLEWNVLKDWPLAHNEYKFYVKRKKIEISEIIIDPSFYMADINRNNNIMKN